MVVAYVMSEVIIEVSVCIVVRLHGDLPASSGGRRPQHPLGTPLTLASPADAPLARLRQAKRRRQDTDT